MQISKINARGQKNLDFYEWDSLMEFTANDKPKTGYHCIPYSYPNIPKTIPFVFYLDIKPNTPLLAHFHGAMDRSISLPYIKGLHVTRGLNASVFIPCDPVLYLNEDIKIGWFSAIHSSPLELSCNIIRHLNLRFSLNRTLLWGGSGGGFAILKAIASCDNWDGYIWNPQTNILEFSKKEVDEFVETLKLDGSLSSSFLSARNSESIVPENQKMLMVQQFGDWHVDRHLKPYLAFLKGGMDDFDLNIERLTSLWVTSSTYLHIGNWRTSLKDSIHFAPPNDFTRFVLEEYVANNSLQVTPEKLRSFDVTPYI